VTNPVVTNPSAWLQYLNDIYVRWINQSADVIAGAADEISTEISTGKQPFNTWFGAVNRLSELSLLSGIEFWSTLFAGPGFEVLPPIAYSGWYAVPGDPTVAHHAEVSDSEPLNRFVSADAIPKSDVSFEAQVANGAKPCPGGLLPAGTANFRLVVARTGFHSGCYTGKVLITTVPPAGPPTPVAVDIEL
jgi:hypothetical protein